MEKNITDRTKVFAIRIIKACSFLDEKPGISKTMSERLLCCGTNIGAYVRKAQAAHDDKEFLYQLEMALGEERETEYWLEILIESELVDKNRFEPLLQENKEIGRILVASVRKLKDKINSHVLN